MLRRLQYNERRLEKIIAAPTVPLYDQFTAFPQEAVEGQLAIEQEGQTLYWYSNGAWHSEVTEFVDLGTFSGFFSAGVIANAPQDMLDGQVFVGSSGAILIYAFGNFLRVKTEPISRPTSIPQDTIPGQIAVGTNNRIYCTPDGINWYGSVRRYVLGFTTVFYNFYGGGSPTDDLVASIYSDVSNKPGTRLATLVGATFFGQSDFDYGNSFKINLVQGVKYWFVLERDSGLDSVNYYGIKSDPTNTGRVATYNSGSSTWTVSIGAKITANWKWYTITDFPVVTPDLGFGGVPLTGTVEMPLGNIAANSRIAVQIGY